MKIKSVITYVMPNPKEHTTLIVLETQEQVMNQIPSLLDCDVSVEIKKWTEKRTLTMNAYYWKLVTELAKKLKVSMAYIHNMMLRAYGEVDIMCDRPIAIEIPDTEDADIKALESTTFHILPTSDIRVYEDETYRVYFKLKGSHEMTKEEFSHLLDGLISECKEQGIPTETQEELERIKALWQSQS